jgi:hypothetical protein
MGIHFTQVTTIGCGLASRAVLARSADQKLAWTNRAESRTIGSSTESHYESLSGKTSQAVDAVFSASAQQENIFRNPSSQTGHARAL